MLAIEKTSMNSSATSELISCTASASVLKPYSAGMSGKGTAQESVPFQEVRTFYFDRLSSDYSSSLSVAVQLKRPPEPVFPALPV